MLSDSSCPEEPPLGPVTDFLFARPSFLGGVARVLDMGNTLTEFNQSLTGAQADAVALRMDWALVGKAMREAMAQYEQEHKALLDEASVGGEAETAAAAG